MAKLVKPGRVRSDKTGFESFFSAPEKTQDRRKKNQLSAPQTFFYGETFLKRPPRKKLVKTGLFRNSNWS